ncbi:beta-ketoacyl-[acyl-carrier-protein] synthase family protein [Cerasicoccus arenae]|uniref:3-oxoacyl-[acyl-carrier-protein] synthase 1 n=1 Tax=Cerasicoccus arenae TaxID=424488 RepID=A0A8J3GDU2_9BACT|nr:beta-ketoacyl-[acyl-carrier-protein] synthase family protein [Cerasicoccus arenae]MBK1857368.1 beta-ketoacyl-[acyl-carrier-protein] synthase family protein [Cerasicoccus arenae]GHC09049.1 beta-ketoacyl-[acyl-carrier-protein] synthase I [Cerasicoccus arenae]
MPRVAITGLGFVTSIGNDRTAVTDSLRELKHGIALSTNLTDKDPISVLGTLKGFDTTSMDVEDWTYPSDYKIRREHLRSMSPHVLYAHCALVQAIADSGLDEHEVSSRETGLFTASAGSPRGVHFNIERMNNLGVGRVSPMAVVSSVVGSLSFNLVASFKIMGASGGFASACASSGHALGYAFDEIALGRQQRMFVVGAEDGNREAILPFAGMRALSPSKDPAAASRPFDKNRNGFVGTGGGAVMVLENLDAAKARGAKIYAELLGWGQASDGYNVAISHPEGHGLAEAMTRAMNASKVNPEQVEYINAHATSTQIGDLSEIQALRKAFPEHRPFVSSTKALTGHGLSLASVMEAGFTAIGMHENFTPGSANITTLDPKTEGVNILTETHTSAPKIALKNSSGFGGANVTLVMRAMD